MMKENQMNTFKEKRLEKNQQPKNINFENR